MSTCVHAFPFPAPSHLHITPGMFDGWGVTISKEEETMGKQVNRQRKPPEGGVRVLLLLLLRSAAVGTANEKGKIQRHKKNKGKKERR